MEHSEFVPLPAQRRAMAQISICDALIKGAGTADLSLSLTIS